MESNDLDDIRSFLEARVQDCISNNAPSGFVNSLRALLLDFIDIFRISLCSDPSVKVTPLILKQLLSLLNEIFILCREFNLKLSASKCRVFMAEALWCGNVYSSKGISVDPKRIQALQNFSLPKNAGELMQFVCAATWLSSSIPDFASKIAPLRQLLEQCLASAPTRSKKYASRLLLSGSGCNLNILHHS